MNAYMSFCSGAQEFFVTNNLKFMNSQPLCHHALFSFQAIVMATLVRCLLQPQLYVRFNTMVCPRLQSSQPYCKFLRKPIIPLSCHSISASYKKAANNNFVHLGSKIGHGLCGNVFKTVYDGKSAALKLMPARRSDMLDITYQEVCTLLKLKNNKNVVEIYSDILYFEKDDELFAGYYMELCEKYPYTGLFNSDSLRLFSRQLFHAVQSIHSDNICHGDIHFKNIAQCDGKMKLIDFGKALSLTTSNQRDDIISACNTISNLANLDVEFDFSFTQFIESCPNLNINDLISHPWVLNESRASTSFVLPQ